MNESAIQRAVVQHLQARARKNVCWFHVANNPRNAIAGANLKKMGAVAGVADLIFLHQGEAFALELKTEDGRWSDSQKEFAERWQRARGYYGVAYGLDEALEWLKQQGLIE